MQRRHSTSTPVWPYIAVVACLFGLSVLAPRLWRAGTHSGDSIAQAAPSRASRTLARETRLEDRLVALSDFYAPRQKAAIAPPVARRHPTSPAAAALPSPSERELDLRLAYRSSLRPLSAPETSLPLVASPSSVAKRTAAELPVSAAGWPCPSALLRQLEELAQHAKCAPWASSATNHIEALVQNPSLSSGQIARHLVELELLVSEAETMAGSRENLEIRTDLLRARYALQRRLAVWRQVHQIVHEGLDTYLVSLTDAAELLSRLDVVDRELGTASLADDWRRYLLLDELRLVLEAGDTTQQGPLARMILARMESSQLSDKQVAFLRHPYFGDLSQALRSYAMEPIDYARVMDDMELYEETRSTVSATQLARYYQIIRWSTVPEVKHLADTVNAHYRNANLRVAVSADLLNRLLPTPISADEYVRDTLLGARVRGRSRTSANLRVALVPDPRRWNVALQVEGNVNSRTSAARGPAIFYSNGESQYSAFKTVLVDRQGVHAGTTEVEASTQMDLNGVETEFDSVPILGWIARSVALQQHDRNYVLARSLASRKLEYMASHRLDQEVDRQVAEVEKQFRTKWLEPLRKLQLQPVALDMQTTPQELFVRYRLASEGQLGAHTPRPAAPRNSLFSVQVHESALNNTLEQLKLDGKRYEVRQLYRELADTFNRTELEVPEEIPEGVYVQFASRNAIRVQCEDDCVALTLRIAELKRDRRTVWRNFAVRVYYVPDATQDDANLVRDEERGIELVGSQHLGLRATLSAVFAKGRPFNLINRQLLADDRLHDVKVTQFTIRDGWVGVALGSDGPLPTANVPKSHGCAQR